MRVGSLKANPCRSGRLRGLRSSRHKNGADRTGGNRGNGVGCTKGWIARAELALVDDDVRSRWARSRALVTSCATGRLLSLWGTRHLVLHNNCGTLSLLPSCGAFVPFPCVQCIPWFKETCSVETRVSQAEAAKAVETARSSLGRGSPGSSPVLMKGSLPGTRHLVRYKHRGHSSPRALQIWQFGKLSSDLDYCAAKRRASSGKRQPSHRLFE